MNKTITTTVTEQYDDFYGTVIKTTTTRQRVVSQVRRVNDPRFNYVYDHQATLDSMTDEDIARITGFDHG